MRSFGFLFSSFVALAVIIVKMTAQSDDDCIDGCARINILKLKISATNLRGTLLYYIFLAHKIYIYEWFFWSIILIVITGYINIVDENFVLSLCILIILLDYNIKSK